MSDFSLSMKAKRNWNLVFVLALTVVAGGACALRVWAKDTAYGLFVDEVLYGSLAQSAVTQGVIPLDSFGHAFLLHPPLVFLVASGLLTGFGALNQNDIVQLVDQVRWANIIVGALTAALTGLVVRFALRSHIRQASIAGILVAVLVAVDPFVTRSNGRFMLETITMAMALIGYTILLPAVNRGRLNVWTMIGSGLLLGLAILGKDMMVMAIAIPLIVAFFMKLGGISRARWFSILLISAVPYALYIAYVSQTEHWQKWIEDKIFGIRRAVGLEQVTGFHAPGAPNLFDKIVGELGTYWPTYLVVLLAVPATIYLLVKGTAGERLVALFTIGPGALLAFDLVAGTLEEQFLYYLLIPAFASVMITADILVFSRAVRRAIVERLVVGLVLLGAVVTPSILHQVQIRTIPDDAYQNAIAYIAEHRQPGEAVAWAEGTTNYTLAQYFYMNDRELAGPWASPYGISKHGVKYVLTTSKEIREGYTYLDRRFLKRTLPNYADPVFSSHSRWNGLVQVWKVR